MNQTKDPDMNEPSKTHPGLLRSLWRDLPEIPAAACVIVDEVAVMIGPRPFRRMWRSLRSLRPSFRTPPLDPSGYPDMRMHRKEQ